LKGWQEKVKYLEKDLWEKKELLLSMTSKRSRSWAQENTVKSLWFKR